MRRSWQKMIFLKKIEMAEIGGFLVIKIPISDNLNLFLFFFVLHF